MSLLGSLLGGGGSSTSSSTEAANNQVGVGGDAAAPISGGGSSQANAAGSIAAGKSVSIKATDQRNLGNQISKVGDDSAVTITTSDPTVALGSILAQHETAASALAANVAAQRDALEAAQNLGGLSYEFAGSVFNRAEANRQQATLEVINSARSQSEDANSRSESIARDALGKLAEQRAPDGAATTKLVLVLGGGLLVLALAWIFRRRPKA